MSIWELLEKIIPGIEQTEVKLIIGEDLIDKCTELKFEIEAFQNLLQQRSALSIPENLEESNQIANDVSAIIHQFRLLAFQDETASAHRTEPRSKGFTRKNLDLSAGDSTETLETLTRKIRGLLVEEAQRLEAKLVQIREALLDSISPCEPAIGDCFNRAIQQERNYVAGKGDNSSLDCEKTLVEENSPIPNGELLTRRITSLSTESIISEFTPADSDSDATKHSNKRIETSESSAISNNRHGTPIRRSSRERLVPSAQSLIRSMSPNWSSNPPDKCSPKFKKGGSTPDSLDENRIILPPLGPSTRTNGSKKPSKSESDEESKTNRKSQFNSAQRFRQMVLQARKDIPIGKRSGTS